MNTKNEFIEWLHGKIRASGKTQAELAHAGGISASQVSRVLSGTREPGSDFCNAMADALNIDAQTVFHKAGLLPPEPEDEQRTREALHLFRQMAGPQRQLALIILRALVRDVGTLEEISEMVDESAEVP